LAAKSEQRFNLTCIEYQGVLYPEVIREQSGIPPSKRLMVAIAIGYPNPNFPANQIHSEREPAENMTTWVE
jgi:nitroreductase